MDVEGLISNLVHEAQRCRRFGIGACQPASNLLDRIDLDRLNANAVSSIQALRRRGFVTRLTTERESRLLGSRLICHGPMPRFTELVAVLSSRLGRKLDQRTEWFDAMRTAILSSRPRETIFAFNATTSSGRFVQHASRLFGRQVLEIRDSDPDVSIEKWWREVIEDLTTSDNPLDAVPNVFVSPPISQEEPSADTELENIPIADRCLVALTNRVIVIHVRPGGNITALCNYLLSPPNFNKHLHVALSPSLIPDKLSKQFLDRGAIGWYLYDEQSDSQVMNRESDSNSTAPIISIPEVDWRYLSHWTRRQRGTWIDQPECDYLDELILGSSAKDRSALASLARILTSERILANSGSGTDNSKTVSLTEVRLSDWSDRRTYRRHRSRWDFEPYGISIDRDWLIHQGTRRVIYGSEDDRTILSEAEKPFFQVQQSSNGSTDIIDWRVEKEWRIVGDIDLAKIPNDQAFAFVPTTAEANHIATFSKWPVAVLESG